MSDNFGANPAYIKWDVVRGDTSGQWIQVG
jgi:hypothetical protein